MIDYRATPDWHVEVRAVTAGHGADVVVEVGGSGTFEKSVRSAAVSGEVALVGSLDDSQSMVDLRTVSATVVTIRRIAVGSRAQFFAMLRAIDAAKLHPVIDRTFTFDEAADAFRYFETRHRFGKVVVVHSPPP